MLFLEQSSSSWSIHVLRWPPAARLAYRYFSVGSLVKAWSARRSSFILRISPNHFNRLIMIIAESVDICDLASTSSFVILSRYEKHSILRRQLVWKLSSLRCVDLFMVHFSELYKTTDDTRALYNLHLRGILSCLLFQSFWKLANRCLPSASLALISFRSPCCKLTKKPRYLKASTFSNSTPSRSWTLQEKMRNLPAFSLPQYRDSWIRRLFTVANFLVHLWQVRLFSSPTNFDALSSTLFEFLDLQNLASCTLQPLAVSKRRLQPEHTRLSSSETADDLLFAVYTRSATTDLSSLLTVTSSASAELFSISFSPASVSNQPAFFFLPTSTSLPRSSRDWFPASMRVPKRPLRFPVRTSTFLWAMGTLAPGFLHLTPIFFVFPTLIIRPTASAKDSILCRFAWTSESETPNRTTSSAKSKSATQRPMSIPPWTELANT